MQTKDIVLLAVTLLILGEVTYLLARLPKTNIKAKDRAILVDTSVLMDGRITGIAATGFIGGTLVIPRSVIGEMQFLADHADADKRARARHGLDVVSQLQQMDGVTVELLQDGSKAEEGVDERLLNLAKQHHATICTLDYNLNKVAVVEAIPVLNINELAQSLRMSYLPGEQMMLELVQKGQESHQGVGYLPDGTMVVVEQANGLIGKTVHVEITRSIQTAAGRMMFARRVEAKKEPAMKKTTPAAATVTRAARSQAPSGRAPKRTTSASAQPTSEKALSNAQQPHQSHSRRHRQVTQVKNDERASKVSNKPARANSRRRVDHEAALIALVDDQQ